MCTLKGEVQEVDRVIYCCKIRDRSRRIHKFSAHGLDTLTETLGGMLSKKVMHRLFPNVVVEHALTGASTIDYLIRIRMASW